MDTKRWGPSGWKLLHLISFQYPNKPSNEQKKNIKEFYELLIYLLPCKYCRASIKKFYKEIPIDEYLDNKKKLIEFVYLIHNKVNDKLREQKILKYNNPQLHDVKNFYNNINKQKVICSNRNYQGWDFIYSIAFNNYSKRINNIKYKFIILLTKLHPCYKIRNGMDKLIKKISTDKSLKSIDDEFIIKLIFIIECKFNGNYKLIQDELSIIYDMTCNKYISFRALCSNSKKKTCSNVK